VSLKVRPVAKARRNLGRRELKPFRDRKDDRPQTEIARKLYRQATNKIAGVSDEAAAFLRSAQSDHGIVASAAGAPPGGFGQVRLSLREPKTFDGRRT
jgi:hypothetical protein